jgi:hypothetical protein
MVPTVRAARGSAAGKLQGVEHGVDHTFPARRQGRSQRHPKLHHPAPDRLWRGGDWVCWPWLCQWPCVHAIFVSAHTRKLQLFSS